MTQSKDSQSMQGSFAELKSIDTMLPQAASLLVVPMQVQGKLGSEISHMILGLGPLICSALFKCCPNPASDYITCCTLS